MPATICNLEAMIIGLTVTAVLLYLLASALLGNRLFRRLSEYRSTRWTPLGAGLAGAVVHGIALYGVIFTGHGMDLAFFNMLSLVAWLVVVLLLIAALTQPVENLGIAILPLAAVAALLQPLLHTGPELVAGEARGIDLHIVLSVLSYSLLAIAVVQAGLLAVQDYHLRNRHPGGFIRALPALETMERLLFQMIGVGFVLLTFSLLSGAAFLEDIFAQHLVHKTLLSIVAWLVFAVLLWGRWRMGWRGRTAIRWTLGGFIALMLAYFGSKLVLELILGY